VGKRRQGKKTGIAAVEKLLLKRYNALSIPRFAVCRSATAVFYTLALRKKVSSFLLSLLHHVLGFLLVFHSR
jgi:hypothetical protein